ncbi:MAG: ABC transporter ATP-binding protein, partial [Arthrobacter sp.]|uniref:ABC transporter ATP-binding protein n=1 Tax=Arthrobacter sp. TaxID=1667 RepID=UPI003488B88B
MSMEHAAWGSLWNLSTAKGRQFAPGTVRRVVDFARRYQGRLIAFILVSVVAAVLAVATPVLAGQVVDAIVAGGPVEAVLRLALLIALVAVAEAGVTILTRWLSSSLGEQVIYDLRTEVFDHVQRMPIAFFTRTRTGALVSRLNNDVIGAQRAFTGTLGTVVSNVITLVTTLIAMAALDWRLTILAVVLLPLFLLPAKRVGRKLADIGRDGMNLNADMNNTMTERFGVSGALLVKTYGRHHDEYDAFAERAAGVRDIGVRSAMYTRTFLAILGLVGAVGTAALYGFGGRQVING